jgi:hypothetical protein
MFCFHQYVVAFYNDKDRNCKRPCLKTNQMLLFFFYLLFRNSGCVYLFAVLFQLSNLRPISSHIYPLVGWLISSSINLSVMFRSRRKIIKKCIFKLVGQKGKPDWNQIVLGAVVTIIWHVYETFLSINDFFIVSIYCCPKMVWCLQ